MIVGENGCETSFIATSSDFDDIFRLSATWLGKFVTQNGRTVPLRINRAVLFAGFDSLRSNSIVAVWYEFLFGGISKKAH